MNTRIYCRATQNGTHSFYVSVMNKEYFLFSQDFRQGVQAYYKNGVRLDEATNYSKAHNDSAIKRTMTKIPIFIEYIEKEYGIVIYEKKAQKKNPRSVKAA